MPINFLSLPFELKSKIRKLITERDECTYHTSQGRHSITLPEPHSRRVKKLHETECSTSPPPDTIRWTYGSELRDPDLISDFWMKQRFAIRCKYPESLNTLRSFNHVTISHLRYLTVVLRKTSVSPFRYPNEMPVPASMKILDAWNKAARHLSKHIEPFSLSLNFRCSCRELERGKKACKPFKYLRLRECAIRLQDGKSSVMQSLAKSAVLESTLRRETASRKPFPFTALPVELQISILRYTDLVAPMKELDWNATKPFRASEQRAREIHSGECDDHCCQANSEVGCFCSISHSAFSSVCQCWEYPDALFQVSRSFREHARRIFFGDNTFIMSGPSSFFKWVQSISAVSLIRSIEIVRAVDSSSWTIDMSPYIYHGLANSSSTVKTSMGLEDIQDLTLKVLIGVICNTGTHSWRFIEVGDLQSLVWETQLEQIYSLARRVRLKDCFVGVHSFISLRLGPGHVRAYQGRRTLFNNMEQLIEQTVMGETYDSATRGKYPWRERRRDWGHVPLQFVE